MQETHVRPLSCEDPQRKEWLSSSVFLPGEFHGLRSWQATVHGVAKSRVWLSYKHNNNAGEPCDHPRPRDLVNPDIHITILLEAPVPGRGKCRLHFPAPRWPQHIGLAAPQGDAQPPVGHQCPKSWEIGPQAPGRVCTFHTSISVPEEGDSKWQISEKHHDKLRDFWVQGVSSIL